MTLADLVDGNSGVKRVCSGDPRQLYDHKGERSASRTHHKVGLSNLPGQIADENAVFAVPSRLNAGQARTPVQLERAVAARHQDRRARVEASERPRSLDRRRERQETVSGRGAVAQSSSQSPEEAHVG